MSQAKSSRHIYLEKKSLAAAREIILTSFQGLCPLGTESVPVVEAVGRVLAEGVCAQVSSPPCDLAAMDGIAVLAENTFDAGETTPKSLTLGTDAFYVNTGNAIPQGANAVIMIEDVNVIDDATAEIMAPAFPWQYVRRVGEDIVATEMLFPANHLIRPYCVGALLTAGVFTVPVRKKPHVLIIPTGDELIDWTRADEAIAADTIVESNSYMLGGMIEQCGGAWARHAIVADDSTAISAALEEAVAANSYQMIFLVGGSSAGARDYSRAVIGGNGEILVHGVTMMPGKPVIAGDVAGVPVFGIPGYPVSGVVCFEQLVQPLLLTMQGLPDREPAKAMVTLTKKVSSRLGVEEFLRVKLGRVEDRIMATQLPRGAGAITSLAEADAFVRIPTNTEGLAEAVTVPAELIRPLSEIENTVVVVGSHDNALDILADEIGRHDSRLKLASSHVGSLGGLQALARGYCHLGGCHLLDPASGEYNISYVRKYLADVPVRLVRLVSRSQGLMVAPGNPRKINGLDDLTRGGVSFINRQAGSGTRVLLDYRLSELGIAPGIINGYAREAYTHMEVAVAVASNTADAGLGIMAAARALGLDFVPVVTEQYDLVIPERFCDLPGIKALFSVIESDSFKTRVNALGGYSTKETGTVIHLE